MLKLHLLVRFMLLYSMATLVISPGFAAKGYDATGGMTEAERAYLLSELKSSEADLLTSIETLTPAQWTFKPSPDVWSIEECTEHLILAEDLLFNEAQKVLKTPAVMRLPNATSDGDRQLVAQMEDRNKKAMAPKVIQPTGMFSTPESAAQEFKLRRDKTITYVNTTNDPLRVHVGDGPAGPPADVYQFLLEMSAHSVRHTAQIREVKASTGYPSFALGTVAARPLAFPQATPSPVGPISHSFRDGQHDFDFHFGTWETHIIRLVHPLSGSATWVELNGTVTVREVWDGRANLEEIEAGNDTVHFQGLTLFLYNPESHQWSQTFANINDGTLSEPPLIGDFKDGRGELYCKDTFNGRSILVRFVWSDITPNSHHVEQSFSDDGGKTWEPNFIANLTRVKK